MSLDIQKRSNARSRHWSKQLYSQVKNTKLDLWREDEVKLPNNFYSAIGQLKSLERHLQKDYILRKRYQDTIDTDVRAGYVRKVQQVELNDTRDKLQWYLPHHPVNNPHKSEKVRRVYNAAAK